MSKTAPTHPQDRTQPATVGALLCACRPTPSVPPNCRGLAVPTVARSPTGDQTPELKFHQKYRIPPHPDNTSVARRKHGYPATAVTTHCAHPHMWPHPAPRRAPRLTSRPPRRSRLYVTQDTSRAWTRHLLNRHCCVCPTETAVPPNTRVDYASRKDPPTRPHL